MDRQKQKVSAVASRIADSYAWAGLSGTLWTDHLGKPWGPSLGALVTF